MIQARCCDLIQRETRLNKEAGRESLPRRGFAGSASMRAVEEGRKGVRRYRRRAQVPQDGGMSSTGG
ncbi:MAG: hypothetical protein C5B58_03605 [Acidobacteria bacterium]|nr:MAG: hypothetical protein C5B58_03605 [Acidobacteriota bacterium]